MSRRDSEVVMEDVQLIFRNFQGKESVYNRAGDRNFCILLTDEVAAQMARDGWNISQREARNPEDGDTGYSYIKVKISYNEKARPPQVFLITGTNRTSLGEDEIEILDWADFENVDLILAPFDWNINGKTGRTAYLRSIYAEIYVDPLMKKYGVVTARTGDRVENE